MAPGKALKTTFINPELSGVDFAAKFPQLLTCHAIAIGFTKSSDSELPIFHLVGPKTLIRKIESTFALNLLDELTFFSPSGKAGEIFVQKAPAATIDTLARSLVNLFGLR